ncbi:MAG: malto-oligosyltrehalose synthase [Pseudonocardiales bacterium]
MSGPPRSTYRLQLHAGFDFATAGDVAGYLADLGVSHVYTSPLLQAAAGSTHGYDVVDHRHANSELGGELGRQAFAERLRDLRLGCVVDLVPNHMSVATPAENRWWWDVLARGRASVYAGHFDIDWSRGRLLLPVLDDADDEHDRLRVIDGQLDYCGKRFPIAAGTSGGPPAVVHARQHYELASWRRASGELNYRRFFDVTELAGIRVEHAAVFAETHGEVLRWIADGDVDGLRIDHPDGLADPRGYLDRLAQAAPGAWIVVEKILHPGEDLPGAWACAGTTGYDALRELTGVLLDPAGEAPLTRLYADLTGAETDYAELAHDLKLKTAQSNLAAETHRLARLLPAVPNAADAVAEVMACFAVYRSYLPDSGQDQLAAAVQDAARRRPGLAAAIEEVDVAARAGQGEFAVRLQQTTGMVMAKGVEDTAFYRYHRLLALNEVGGDPGQFAVSVPEFHIACRARQHDRPHAMTTLSTHDTKRNEDVRARLLVLAELPDTWAAAVRDWSVRRPAPDQQLGYLAWQTLVGAWPLGAGRASEYLHKAAREAEQFTSWADQDRGYEAALDDFVAGVYGDEALLGEIAGFVDLISAAGWSNSLSQKLMQLTMPGVPDIYQGSELWDLSLVDPDNRRPVDFALRRSLLAELAADAAPPIDDVGRVKLHVVAQALRLRADCPAAFVGSYEPVNAAGASAGHLLAFARGGEAITVATRLLAGLEQAGGWRDTIVSLPPGEWTDRLCGSVHSGDTAAGDVLARLPVALLVRG